MGRYLHFTDEEKEQANGVDLEHYLKCRGEKLIKAGREYRLESDKSITVQGNRWYDHSKGVGGKAINFLMAYENLSFAEAVITLLEDSPLTSRCISTQSYSRETKPFKMPQRHETPRRMFAYLIKTRLLDKEVVESFYKSKLIYEDEKYHNVVFLGTDEKGVPKHAHKRSTYTQGKKFRINVEGSHPAYAFNFIGKNNTLFVFEAPIDMLSYISLHPSNWKDNSYVALGRKSIARIGRDLLQRDYKAAMHLSYTKDWNEDIVHQKLGNQIIKKPIQQYTGEYKQCYDTFIQISSQLEDQGKQYKFQKQLEQAKQMEEHIEMLWCNIEPLLYQGDYTNISVSNSRVSALGCFVHVRKEVIMQQGVTTLIVVFAVIGSTIGFISLLSHYYTLSGIKNKTVGDGQHGTARFATKTEIKKTFDHVPFNVKAWRKGKHLPTKQGLIVGSVGRKNHMTALVDSDDIHCLMIGASGVGKTAFFLYPNLEYACAVGMSFITTDTKGDLYRNYATIAKEYYDYNICVIDLRNPMQSDGNNMLHLVNKYMDMYQNSQDIRHKVKAEKYAKILSKTIITSGSEGGNYGQNQYFYDSAEGLLTAMILLIAEFLKPIGREQDKRHIISVFKMVQELLQPSQVKGKNQFQLLMKKLPNNHKAKWFAGSALNTADQAMLSIMSTTLARLNTFLDSEMEQILCFDTAIDTEKFCKEKSAIFLVMPEEDSTKYPIISLLIQQLYREILAVADETDGKLGNRVMMYVDEAGTLPPIDSAELMFSASRSRRLSIVEIIQSFAQLERNYGKEGSEIIVDNCQDAIFSGFAPNSQSAEALSKNLGSKTVLSGSVNRGKNDPSKTLQMIERPLITSDELKALKKGTFIVTKTGTHPMKTKLRLFLDWGITFDKPYSIKQKGYREVSYADKEELEKRIFDKASSMSINQYSYSSPRNDLNITVFSDVVKTE